MKKIKYIIKTACLSAVLTCTSCNEWFSIYPESEMVYEDVWADKNDVLSVVASCYRGMIEPGFMDRLVVWGEVRSDNVILGPGLSAGDNMQYLLEANVTANNGYASWADFYKVINYCNTVLENAPGVMDKDPNFRQEELDMYMAEASAVRAFCYFTLVRTFRDVPYITTPYIDDTNEFYVPQANPDEVLRSLVVDLESRLSGAPDIYTQVAYTKGRFTRNGIRALIADISLWLGDYPTCVKYCDQVLSDTKNPLFLEESSKYNYNVYIRGNSQESIFELQFIQGNIHSYTVNEYYGRIGSGNSRGGYQKLTTFDLNTGTSPLFGETDVRKYNAFFKSGNNPLIPIQKYIADRYVNPTGVVRESDYMVSSRNKNWIVYRLPDIYLMKAEALVQVGPDLQGALDLVSKTYDRANPTLPSNSLPLSSYNNGADMLKLILDERQREFIFEGKRYYDLVRLANKEKTASNIVDKYLLRKYGENDQATIKSKINNMDALYMPIHADELKLNSKLVQNKFYNQSTNVSK